MPKEKVNFYLVVCFSVILGLAADYLFYKKMPGVSFFIFNWIAILFSFILAKRLKKELSLVQLFFSAAILIFSAAFFLRSSEFLGFFNFIGSGYLLILFFSLFLDKNIVNFSIAKYIYSPIFFLFSSFANTSGFFNRNKAVSNDKKIFISPELRGVLRGIIISLPILAILLSLLYRADAAFQGYIDTFLNFKINIDFEFALRLCIIFIVFYIFAGIFSRIAESGGKNENIIKEGVQKKYLGFIESATILSLVEFLFLVFIIFQFYYLFGGRDYVWGIDKYITYAEYAKNGFNELIKVSFISFLLVYALDSFARIESVKEKKLFKVFSAILVGETFIIIFSAVKRLSLYVDGYGFTFLRFFSFALLAWIFLVFLAFLYKIFLEKKEQFFIFSVFCLTIAFWAGINIINPDAFIVRKNIERFVIGKKLDPSYFYYLSDDAIPEVVKIFQLNIDEGIKKEMAVRLNSLYNRNVYCDLRGFGYVGHDQCAPVKFSEAIGKNEKNQDWRSYNYAREKALAALMANSKEIKKYLLEYWKAEEKRCNGWMEECNKNCEYYIPTSVMSCKENCTRNNNCDNSNINENIKLYE